MNDSAFHAEIGVLNNTSSILVSDGTAVGPSAGGTSTLSGAFYLGGVVGNVSLAGYICEGGIWAGTNGAFSSTQYGNMNSNINSRWSFK